MSKPPVRENRTATVCLLSLLVLFSGCHKSSDSSVDDTGEATVIPPIEWVFHTVTSPNTNDGFGTSLALGDGRLFIGAPHGELGGVVYEYNDVRVLTPIMDEEEPGALGAALAFHGGELYAAAPLSSSGAGVIIRRDNVSVTGSSGQLLGKRLYVTGGAVYASSTTGLFQLLQPVFGQIAHRLGLEFILESSRIGGLSIENDRIYVGTPLGPEAVVVGDMTLPRTGALDEAGYALCRANYTGDEQAELVVGAPGANRVDIFTEDESGAFTLYKTLDGGKGRFGHAVACRDGLLVVGSPLAGEQHQGALWRFDGEPADWVVAEPYLNGTSPWSQLGFELIIGEAGEIYAGAPGGDSTSGSVYIYSPAIP